MELSEYLAQMCHAVKQHNQTIVAAAQAELTGNRGPLAGSFRMSCTLRLFPPVV